MGTLVGIFGTTHNPLLWRTLQGDVADDLRATKASFMEFRDRVAGARPDVILVVATDHLTQWFDDNMPAFLVGRSELIPATFPNEEREFGIPVDMLPGDLGLARDILTGGLERGVDFSSSREFRADHSVYLPYAFLCPDKDIPVVPVFTNAIAPPFPPARRFVEVGRALRAAIEASPLDRRVVIVASGHLATEVGGPRQFQGAPDPSFDEQAVRWVADGDVEAMLAELTPARMLAAGNVTAQFLNFLVAVGAAEGRPAVHAAGVRSRFASSPFFAWDPPEVRP
ncbi:extradiol ring-cleavage dioxygenase [Phytoactinopolyspora limicola]|uniref:DODA-type extradiol aromatic ring-opening family dioxygenase n=1 Tax=Phytoactinopolyspora limicola TaxID=2715536 RepID=UPI00140A059A|nr:extradiol ring-cleavage dioxygenase [Phytoactinopolyspora limicola]